MTQSKALPAEITHLDIIKTFAVIVMIIDHIGYYFFPEQLWFRTIGRIGGAPIWFFLIGYAMTRELPNRLLIGALILAVADFLLFQRVLAFNVLVTIIILRLTIDYVMGFLLRTRYIFFIGACLLALFYVVSQMIFEYGTLAMLFAMLGYLTRHYETVTEETFVTKQDYYGFAAFTFFASCLLQNMTFGFSNIQFLVMAVLTVVVMGIFIMIKPITFPEIRNENAKRFLQYCGRNTLDIYVAHLILFKVVVFAILALN